MSDKGKKHRSSLLPPVEEEETSPVTVLDDDLFTERVLFGGDTSALSSMEEFKADYGLESGEKQPWEATLDFQQYFSLSSNPTFDSFAGDPKRRPGPRSRPYRRVIPRTPLAQLQLDTREGQFVREVEQAIIQYKGNVPLWFIHQFSPEELREFGADRYGIDLEHAYTTTLFMAARETRLAAADAKAQQRFDNETFFNKFGLTLGSLGEAVSSKTFSGDLFGKEDDPDRPTASDVWDAAGAEISYDALYGDAWLEATGRNDQIYEKEIGLWRTYQQGAMERLQDLAGDGRGYSDYEITNILDLKETEIRQLIVGGLAPHEAVTNAYSLRTSEQVFNPTGNPLPSIGRFPGRSVMGLLSAAFSVGSSVAGALLWAADVTLFPLIGTAYGRLAADQKKAQAETLAAFEEGRPAYREDYVVRAWEMGVTQVWDELPEMNPEAYEEYMAAAGGNGVLAAGLFGADVVSAPEVKEQLEVFQEDMYAEDEAIIEAIKETDFNVGHALLNTLATYGRNVPGRLSTGFALLLTDGDYWDDFTMGKYKQVWNDLGDEIERKGFSPASVFGLEGTAVGLGIDIGMGIAFDPLTWLFGPKLASGSRATSAAASIDEAMMLLKSPVLRAMKADIRTIAQSQAKGYVPFYHVSSWLDSIAQTELAVAYGLKPQLLRLRDWSFKKGANKAMEVDVDRLLSMLSPEEITLALGKKVGKEADAVIEGWGINLLDDGFQEAGTITLSRADRTLHFTDGVKRALAAQKQGIERMPVSLRIVDDAAEELRGLGVGVDEFAPAGLRTELKPLELGAGEVIERPNKVLPLESLIGSIPESQIDDIVYRAVVLRANRPSDGARSVMLTSWRSGIVETITRGKLDEWRLMFRQFRTTKQYQLDGAGAVRRIQDDIIRIWGDDIEGAERWMQQLMDMQMEGSLSIQANEAKLQALIPYRRAVDELLDVTGGEWDDLWRWADEITDATDFGDIPAARVAAIRANSRQVRATREHLQRELTAAQKELDAATVRVRKARVKVPDQTNLSILLKDMWNDFNREHIVPRWKKEITKAKKAGKLDEIFDADQGIIKWEYLRRGSMRDTDDLTKTGREFLPESVRDRAAKEHEIVDPEGFAHMLNSTLDRPMSVTVPLSPVELVSAATAAGRDWTLLTKQSTIANVRTGAARLNRAWNIDKVLRPATAMTVSADELLRIFHRGGWRAVGRYIGDRGLFLSARINTMLHGSKRGSGFSVIAPGRREAVRKGAELSPRVVERLRKLDEYTVRTQMWERMLYDDGGLGWVDILPDDPIFLDAAKQWMGSMMGQDGFRAFLRGEKAFSDWYYGASGEVIRGASIVTRRPGSKSITTEFGNPEDMYAGWKLLFEDVIFANAKKSGDLERVMVAVRKTAADMDIKGGTQINLPDWVYGYLSAVRGTQKHAPRMELSVLKFTDQFFDRFFLDPINYRRGFVAQLTASAEKARIEGLFLSQDIRIMSDLEVAHALGYKALGGSTRMGVSDLLAQEAMKIGIVPQSYIDDLVQRAVDSEIDHMLYVADRGSRAGKVATSLVTPFGRPYADMAMFWAREMFRKPHYRGIINNDNFRIIGDILTARGNFNPRTPALLSRLAHTDFTIDRGWVNEIAEGEKQGLFPRFDEGEAQGLFPGSEETDISPLLFLPTGGENPLYLALPGFGYIPMWALDMVLTVKGDPIGDPEGYERLVQSIGGVVAGAYFGSSDPRLSAMQRILGGGTTASVIKSVVDAFALFGVTTPVFVSTLIGQIDREVDRGLMVSALMADDTEWDDLFAAASEEEASLLIDLVVTAADAGIAGSSLAETGSRYFLPATNKFSGELDERFEVWMTAAESFPELAGQGDFDDEYATPEERTEYVGRIRKAFYSLPVWERERMIAEQRTLTVNLISSWDWSNYGRNSGILDTELAYRIDGSAEGLARHQIYLGLGYVEPLVGQVRIRRILGLHVTATKKTAKRLYEEIAAEYNEGLWETVVTDETKAMLTVLLEDNSGFGTTYDIRTTRELWEAWGSYAELMETEDLRAEEGLSFSDFTKRGQERLLDYFRPLYAIEAYERPWSTTFPGIDPDSLPDRYRDLLLGVLGQGSDVLAQLPLDPSAEIASNVLFTPKMRKLASAVGIQLTDGMTGEQLYNAVNAVVTGTQTPLASNVLPAYLMYQSDKAAPYQVVNAGMSAIANNSMYNEEWRETVSEFIKFVARVEDRYSEAALGIPAVDQLGVQERFTRLFNTADDNVIQDWDALWKKRYERSHGPLGWTAPEPLSPFDDDGEMINDAYEPIISYITDGDSLDVRHRIGSKVGFEVRLLGVNARDFGVDDEGAQADKDRLRDRLQQALTDGDSIYLVRQPDLYGNVDIYGRELAWLWIGDEPFVFPEEMVPSRDRSGGEE